MLIDRRTILLGGTAAGLSGLCALPAAGSTGARKFELFRGDKRIGQQTMSVSEDAGQIRVAVDIDITVRILGLKAYGYKLTSREVWDAGQLIQLRAETDDNGTAHYVRADRASDGLRVDGSGWSGTLTGDFATTTYWTTDFLRRSTWLSTQDGTPMQVSASRGGTITVPGPSGDIQAQVWQVRGDIPRLDLYYDQAGEWVGNEFDARGETARFVLAERGRDFASLWPG